MEKYLNGYQDKEKIIKGLKLGFDLGFVGEECPLKSKNSNNIVHLPHIIDSFLEHEIPLGRIAGPYSTVPLNNFKCSPLSIVEKQEEGKFRIIHNLSFPYDNRAVNFNIADECKSVRYDTIYRAIELINECESTAWLGKTDIKDAYYTLPINPDCYHLTGFAWKGLYYYFRVLPMGCSSSCSIYSAFSDALKWIMEQRVPNAKIVKVLDDFLFVGNSKENCQQQLNAFILLAKEINIPLATKKTVNACNKLDFLGVSLNTVDMTAILPKEKVQRYAEAIRNTINLDKITLTELKSVIGKLQFACSVIRGGQAFLRRMYDLTINVKHGHYKVRLTKTVKQDLVVWHKFLNYYNGITIIKMSPALTSEILNLYSDSSLTGYGAIFGKKYIAGIFPRTWAKFSITVLEMYPVLAIIGTFADQLKNKTIIFNCDNFGVVYILNKQSSKNATIMIMLRTLVMILLKYNINLIARHISGKTNVTCDILSRQLATKELMVENGFDSQPAPVPTHLQPENLIGSEGN